ncbi:MAG: DUF167 family protein [Gammaproteobacteria bacterium]|nr:DUF167 family protein [Gammaproteobacteria bacterium]
MLILQIYVQPKASKDEISGLHNGHLKIRITAPPVDGKANAHLRKFLARIFKVPQSRVELTRGTNSRQKQFQIRQPRALPSEISKI